MSGIILKIAGGKYSENTGSILDHAREGGITHNSAGDINYSAGKDITQGKYEAPKKTANLLITKVEGPFDDKGNKVDFIKKNIQYTYKATPSRKLKEREIKLLKWAIKVDSGNKKNLTNVGEHNQLSKDGKIIIGITINQDCEKVRVYAFFKKASEKVSVEIVIEIKYPKLYISTTESGFTIQKLYGHYAAKNLLVPYEPAVTVKTYKAYLKFYENGATKDIVEFNVTRDAWWFLGIKDGKYHLLNRTFEPLNGSENLYLTDEIHFPSKAPNECRGYFLTQKNERVIDAEPFETEFDVDNNVIGENRTTKDKAKNVMLHIGGVYKAGVKGLGVEWLGGSLGCFAFIPDNDVYSTEELARKASYNDDYDDDLSNSHWLKITNKINDLRELDIKKRFFIIINKRPNWIKTKEINFDKLLKE